MESTNAELVAFVVIACNAHAPMVAALKSGIASLEQLVAINRIPPNNAGLRDMRAALTAAGSA